MILGAGPVGVELAQIYARFGVGTVLVESAGRILPRDHPRSSETVAEQFAEDGVEIRVGVRATRVRVGGAGRRVQLSEGLLRRRPCAHRRDEARVQAVGCTPSAATCFGRAPVTRSPLFSDRCERGPADGGERECAWCADGFPLRAQDEESSASLGGQK